MTHLDGNMLAGTFADLFSFDVTTATARCAGCGAVAAATAMVYVSDAGSVARCPGCDAVLATVVQGRAGLVRPARNHRGGVRTEAPG